MLIFALILRFAMKQFTEQANTNVLLIAWNNELIVDLSDEALNLGAAVANNKSTNLVQTDILIADLQIVRYVFTVRRKLWINWRPCHGVGRASQTSLCVGCQKTWHFYFLFQIFY